MMDIKGLVVWTRMIGDTSDTSHSQISDSLISDTSDPTDLNTKKTICFVPFNYLDHDPLDPG